MLPLREQFLYYFLISYQRIQEHLHIVLLPQEEFLYFLLIFYQRVEVHLQYVLQQLKRFLYYLLVSCWHSEEPSLIQLYLKYFLRL